MLKRHRKAVFLGAILVVLGVSATVYFFATRSYRSLATVAIKTPLPDGADWYDWINENEVLLAIPDSTSGELSIKKWNVKSRTEERIEGVTHSIASFHISGIQSLSPDYRWLLCMGFQGKENVYYCLSLQGSGYAVFDRDSLNGAWFPDSSRWMTESRIGSPITLTEFPCAYNRKDIPRHYELGQGMEWPHLLGFAPTGAMVIGDIGFHMDLLKQAVVQQYKPGTLQKIREDTIVFPAMCAVDGVEVEPQGDRVLWQLQVDLNQSQPVWLRKAMQYLHHPSESRLVTLFWVCRLNGRSGKIVGYVDGTDAHELHWLPSRTKFSFMIGNSLWVVPVP